MKKFFLGAMIIFLGIQEYAFADVKVSAAGKIAVANASNAPITVTWFGIKNKKGTTSEVIAPSKVVFVDYQADTITTISIFYLKADNTTPLDTLPISFSPTVIAKNLYVYGNSAVLMKDLDMSTATTPFPSRYVAWWSDNIDTTKNTTKEAAIADTTGTGSLVSLYMMSIDGKNTMLSAF